MDSIRGGSVMKILFLSDLHLGSPLFSNESKSIIMALLDKEYDKIFLVGDIIDCWEEDLTTIGLSYFKLFAKLNKLDNVVVLKGNHDPSLADLQNFFPFKEVVTEYELYDGEKSMIIVHGDEFDSLVRKYSWIAKIIFPIHWFFERFGINLKGYFREKLYSIAAKKNDSYYEDLVLDMETKLVGKYKDLFDCIIVGHTHFPKKVEGDDFIYVNCGDWVHNKSYVEYIDGKFRLTEL